MVSVVGWPPHPITIRSNKDGLHRYELFYSKSKAATCFGWTERPEPDRVFYFLPFHWLYIPGWDLTSSLTFRHFSPECTLILQFLHQTRATVSSASSHRRNFGQLLLTPTPGFVQRTFFFAGSLSSILITCPAHLSLSSLIKAVCVRKCKKRKLYSCSLTHDHKMYG